MKVTFYGGSKDGVERDIDPEEGYNLTVVAMVYHPYCPLIEQEIYEMGKDGNLHLRPTEIKPCERCSVIKDDMIKEQTQKQEKRQIEIAFHKAVCNCDYCGIEDEL
jgi:hypothetical protein